MTRPTHALIDGKIHTIDRIEDAGENSAHTHRVHFVCGMLFDVRGEHQFEHHKVDHDDSDLTAHDPKRLAEIKVLGDAHQIQLDKHAPLFADERDKHEMLTAVKTKLADPEGDATEDDAVLAAKLEFALRKMKPVIEAANAAVTAAREAHAQATEDLHKTRKGRDRRWITTSAGMKVALKHAKAPCEGCASGAK